MVSPMKASWAWAGAKRPTEGTKREEQVLDDEAPGEQADDRADLVADDRADPDADARPRARSPASVPEQRAASIWPPFEREGMPRPARQRVADREAEPLADDAEREPGEQAGGELGGDHA